MTNCNSCGILISFVENGFKPDGKIKWKVLNAETNLVHKCPNWKPKNSTSDPFGNSDKDTQAKNKGVKCPICKKYTIQGFCFHKL
jgi:hypothetical protein